MNLVYYSYHIQKLKNLLIFWIKFTCKFQLFIFYGYKIKDLKLNPITNYITLSKEFKTT